jgi:hypothetical protein
MDFRSIEYLKQGNERQRQVYNLLVKHVIFEKLVEFDPVLTGTIPLQIDIASSDLDITCYWTNPTDFERVLNKAFGKTEDFALRKKLLQGQ